MTYQTNRGNRGYGLQDRKMLHIHVIIAVAVLLVTAFAAIIICLCVDIIPIIKSRGSTLASRDSVTKDQTRQLRKSLQQQKALQAANATKRDLTNDEESFLEEDLVGSRKISDDRDLEEDTLLSNSEKQNVSSSMSPPDGREIEQESDICPAPGVSNERRKDDVTTSFQESRSVPVFVSVHSPNTSASSLNTTALSGSTPEATSSQYGHEEALPRVERLIMDKRGEASPATIKKPLLTPHSVRKYDQHSQPSTPRNIRKSGQNPQNISGPSPPIRCVSRVNPLVNRSMSYSPTHECIPSLKPNEVKRSASVEDYHDAPWDSTKQPITSTCQCCHGNYWEHKPHVKIEKRLLGERSDFIDNKNIPNTHNRLKSSAPPLKQRPTMTKSLPGRGQMHLQSRNHRPTGSYQTKKTSPVVTASLHGVGVHHRISPLSSSTSSSPSSLSSHSGGRNHRTKLEDIKEDLSCSEEEYSKNNETNTVGEVVLNLPKETKNETFVDADDVDAVQCRQSSSSSSASINHSLSQLNASGDHNPSCSVSSEKHHLPVSGDDDDEKRILSNRQFVLNMKAVIEGTVTDNS